MSATRAGGLDQAIARLERRAHIGEGGALGERADLLGADAGGARLALTASRVSFLACVRTRRPVDFDGDVAVAERVVVRRADGLRAAGLRLAAARFFAAGLLAVVVLVVVVLVVLVVSRPCGSFPLP